MGVRPRCSHGRKKVGDDEEIRRRHRKWDVADIVTLSVFMGRIVHDVENYCVRR